MIMAASYSTFPAFLPSISLAALLSRDDAAVEAVGKACEEHGFFYLDLSGVNGMTEDWAALLSLAKQYFEQPLEVKNLDDRHSDTWGYEGIGTSAGVEVDHVDGYESFKVSRLELQIPGQYNTTFTKTHNKLFRGFTSRVDLALREILSVLSDRSERDTGLRFENIHSEDKISRSTLALFRYPKQQDTDVGSGHNKHTDLGTLTFLLCQQFGLQVLCHESGGDEWRYVEPKADHAIINVGDSLRFLSRSRYKSAVHQVIPTNGNPLTQPNGAKSRLQGEDRYSIAYFLRPRDDIEFHDSKGRVFTALEWHNRKFDVFRESHVMQEAHSFLTGGMERGGVFIV